MNEEKRRRMTTQRRLILEELRKTRTHPTADEVYDAVRRRLPRISLGTVYRNLDLLVETGEVSRLERTGSQMRFDGETKPHHHVRCLACGRINDVFADMPPLDPASFKADGFAITGVSLDLYGYCGACKKTDA